ncbi:tRNA dihydrouridine synthase DusB [candidate division KSB1 bacterium]
MFRNGDKKIFLAPLAGITSYSFRAICKEFGADATLSEMISADGLTRENTKTLRLLFFHEEERPFGVQIFGNSPKIMAQASKKILKFKPDFIDINLGCPVPKVVKRGSGSALLRDLKKAKEIADAVVNEVDIPVTAKIRSGWDENNIVCVELAKLLEETGISAITVHPRTQKMMFKGEANWDLIKEVKDNINIPVIGNGDILDGKSAEQMYRATGCDHIMIGRGALGNPWIFSEIKHYLKYGEPLPEPGYDEKIDTCLRQFKLSIEKKGKYYGLLEMRKHIAWYLKGIPDNTAIKVEIFSQTDENKVEEILLKYKEEISGLSNSI